MGVVELLHRFKEDARLRTGIILVNLVGIAYGFVYYAPQFAVTPWALWPLVPDSPAAVLYAQAALVAYHFGKRWDLLDALAVLANVQVGLWTVFVLLYYPAFGTFARPLGSDLNFWLLWGHLGMALEAGVFLHDLRPMSRRAWSLLVGYAGLFLVADYTPLLHTYVADCPGLRPLPVPCVPAKEPVLAWTTVGLTLLGLAVAWWGTRVGPHRADGAPPADPRGVP